jgi:hypothetical protein
VRCKRQMGSRTEDTEGNGGHGVFWVSVDCGTSYLCKEKSTLYASISDEEVSHGGHGGFWNWPIGLSPFSARLDRDRTTSQL